MIYGYFAYGSNMNPARVTERGLHFGQVLSASLPGYELTFDKASAQHAGYGHANIRWARDATVEGVLYEFEAPGEIFKMDPFERAPVNYGREVVQVHTRDGVLWAWTYFANAALRQAGLGPSDDYLAHLLAAREYLSADYYAALLRWQEGHASAP